MLFRIFLLLIVLIAHINPTNASDQLDDLPHFYGGMVKVAAQDKTYEFMELYQFFKFNAQQRALHNYGFNDLRPLHELIKSALLEFETMQLDYYMFDGQYPTLAVLRKRFQGPGLLKFFFNLVPEVSQYKIDQENVQNVLYDTSPRVFRSNQPEDHLKTYTTEKHLWDMYFAARSIKFFLDPGDTLVAVGNTPQYVMASLKTIGLDPSIKFMPIALSGHPGFWQGQRDETLCAQVVTPEGLEAYETYLKRIGFLQKPHQRICFVDYLSTGIGIQFLIELLLKEAKGDLDLLPPIQVINLNPHGDQGTFHGKFYRISHIFLDISNQIPRAWANIGNAMRIMPSMAPWQWSTDSFLKKFENNTPQTIYDELYQSGQGPLAAELITHITQFTQQKESSAYLFAETFFSSQYQTLPKGAWLLRVGNVKDLFEHPNLRVTVLELQQFQGAVNLLNLSDPKNMAYIPANQSAREGFANYLKGMQTFKKVGDARQYAYQHCQAIHTLFSAWKKGLIEHALPVLQ